MVAEERSDTQLDQLHIVDVFLSILAFFALASAQPLLDLLGRNAEFFVARSSTPHDIALLALIFTFVIPLLAGSLIALVRCFHQPLARILHETVLGFLGGILLLQILEFTPLSTLPWIELALAFGFGAAMAVMFYRSEPLRSAVRLLAIAPFVVLGLFLFSSSTSQLVFSSTPEARRDPIQIDNPAPVVMVVFDEFPVASLMDADGNIQDDLYPGFARLARDGTWFRNATTNRQETEKALPVILSGINSPPDKIPTATDHPNTLFRLLAGTYDMAVIESITDLCPESVCETVVPPATERWSMLANDLRIVAGHLFLPDRLTGNLPPIDAAWSDFALSEGNSFDIYQRLNVATGGDTRSRVVERFLDSLVRSDAQPSLYFLHTLLPHQRWEYLPTGQRFNKPRIVPGAIGPGWGDNEWLVLQAYQQHLLQVGFMDKIVGDIVERLKDEGIYDDALIVATADHGIAIRPNVPHRRQVTEATIGEIATVPLFIKQPRQKSGFVDTYRAGTADVLPTIADILGIDLPWATAGVSLVSGKRPIRLQSTVEATQGVVTFGVDGSEALATAADKVERFGVGGPFGLAPNGYADLLGKQASDLSIDGSKTYTAHLAFPDSYRDLDLDSPILPTWVTGTVETSNSQSDHVVLAIVVNGEVSAVTTTYGSRDGGLAFGAMIPPESLIDGDNRVTVVLVEAQR
jgi:hypothetical protein